MFKRILVATDGSGYSRRALLAAIAIAEKFNAEIGLLHVVRPADLSDEYTLTEEEIEEIGGKIMDMTLQGLTVNNVKIMKKTIAGRPAPVILREIRRDFDLVVMGTGGHGLLTGALIGSVTQRVLADAACPVLVVK